MLPTQRGTEQLGRRGLRQGAQSGRKRQHQEIEGILGQEKEWQLLQRSQVSSEQAAASFELKELMASSMRPPLQLAAVKQRCQESPCSSIKSKVQELGTAEALAAAAAATNCAMGLPLHSAAVKQQRQESPCSSIRSKVPAEALAASAAATNGPIDMERHFDRANAADRKRALGAVEHGHGWLYSKFIDLCWTVDKVEAGADAKPGMDVNKLSGVQQQGAKQSRKAKMTALREAAKLAVVQNPAADLSDPNTVVWVPLTLAGTSSSSWSITIHNMP